MKKNKKVLLISNFRPDKQYSMLRFSKLLKTPVNDSSLEIGELYPKPIISNFINSKRIKKWASYTDKYLIFKNRLSRELKKDYNLIHITDHSNSVYIPTIRKYCLSKVLVTCHDLIAIKQSKNEFDHAPQISKAGKILQSWILKSLSDADYFSCDSKQSMEDLIRLIPECYKRSEVIHLGTKFSIKGDFDDNYSSDFNYKKENFIIHVGSAAWYKNRNAVFVAFRNAKTKFPDLKLVLVGPKPQKSELDDKLGLWIQKNEKEIIIFENICDSSLQNLYKHAAMLLFPSFIEGFGWPPLEAANYNCPIITVKTGAIYDLLRNYAYYTDPDSQHTINYKVIDVLKMKKHKNLVTNLTSNDDCRLLYYSLYNRLTFNTKSI